MDHQVVWLCIFDISIIIPSTAEMSDHAANYLISTLEHTNGDDEVTLLEFAFAEHTNGKDGVQPLRGKKARAGGLWSRTLF
ncbi:uncharacterized protein N7458_010291 [Penicillium daleae]|uniref:Uncharacterized protein n=1 Tax=Penicillium daleae TaxID=63821 RepID=A0AAD6BYC9_9EURO|nr:uncharacterized protein N7458_010291 [Penicillium daleae]KAJ5439293.1 hypothetical protein N7458_010291 [Penicillium daleae]